MLTDTDKTSATAPSGRPLIHPLGAGDLPEAERILRVAFGTFLGVPEPETFWSDRDIVYSRSRSPHVTAWGATLDGRLVGSNFATKWGSVGFFGPLSVRADLQDGGIGKALLAATMEQFDTWEIRHAALFTFAHSAKHVALYQKYDFHARYLTAVMSAPAAQMQATTAWSRYSSLSDAGKEEALCASREVTETLYPGLDLSGEIRAVHAQGIGDTVLLLGVGGLAAFAVCHYGPRSEAGANTCFIKFGAVRDAAAADLKFQHLLDACGSLAVSVGMPNLSAGVNLARREAYRHLLSCGFRTEIQGVAMHRQDDPGYCRPGVFILDDWR